jgi:hypothetical protein
MLECNNKMNFLGRFIVQIDIKNLKHEKIIIHNNIAVSKSDICIVNMLCLTAQQKGEVPPDFLCMA